MYDAVAFEPMFAPWVILLAALAAGAGAWFYYRDRDGGLAPRRRAILLALRLGGLGTLVVILTGPELSRRRTYKVGRPLSVVIDTSGSMSRADSGADGRRSRLDSAKAALSGALAQLAAQYELSVHSASGGSGLITGRDLRAAIESLEAEGERTALGDGLMAAAPRTPPAAILVLSDGASNSGTPLTRVAQALGARGVRVFAVPFGRAAGPNVAVRRVLGPKVLLRGEPSAFFAEISMSGGAGGPVEVALKDGDTTLATAEAAVAGLVRLDFKPDRDGDVTYTVEAGQAPGEEVLADNRAQRTVRISGEKLKVLYVEDQPRWEYRFIRNAMMRDGRIEPKVLLLAGDKETAEFAGDIAAFPHARSEIFGFDCIVVGDVPRDFFLPNDVENLSAFASEGGGGVLFVAGPRHDPSAYAAGPLSQLCPADFAGVAQAPAEGFAIALTDAGARNPALTLSAGDQKAVYAGLPKILWLAKVQARPAATVLATSVPEDIPVIIEQAFGRGRTALVATDELWRWRSRGGDRYVYRLWAQLVRYLGARRLAEGGAGELSLSSDEYARGDRAGATAYLENGLGTAVDDATAEGFIEGENGKRIAVAFSADANARGLYRADFPVGEPGRYTLSVRGPEGLISARFVVSADSREAFAAAADTGALENLVRATGGRMLSPDRILDIVKYFPPQGSVETRVVTTPLWASYWLVFPLALLFSAEWILRKRWGLL